MAERHKILVEDRDRSISENNNLGVGKKSPDPFPSSNGSQPNDANKMLRIDTFGSDASGNSGEEPEIDLDAVSYFDDFSLFDMLSAIIAEECPQILHACT